MATPAVEEQTLRKQRVRALAANLDKGIGGLDVLKAVDDTYVPPKSGHNRPGVAHGTTPYGLSHKLRGRLMSSEAIDGKCIFFKDVLIRHTVVFRKIQIVDGVTPQVTQAHPACPDGPVRCCQYSNGRDTTSFPEKWLKLTEAAFRPSRSRVVTSAVKMSLVMALGDNVHFPAAI
ncbi:uncharacterized protein B0I36DRAFT_356946 [Microdochium trichocladiopsis]|uniref:Uncharacterized protein n=1 Tax=Microdochium trichocladiopsis TaxID=1682393 RepID=A0A9P9BGV1_9PEZI|nr:uncharacterized protein B0I36DRAFT_356946 [Microdochium trichocladiopsis]KAH7007852.1 hypothetical protein B0I36DRAFT_356946 [Microdochium trichocladiopsis]